MENVKGYQRINLLLQALQKNEYFRQLQQAYTGFFFA